jgi:hypothetical protein
VLTNRWRVRRGIGSVWNLDAIASELARLDALGLDAYRDITTWLETDDKGKRGILNDLAAAGSSLPPETRRRDAPRLICSECEWTAEIEAINDLLDHCELLHDRSPTRLERTPRFTA